ncbi:MAG: hypothetical protein ACOX0A_10055 [Thermoguttaceae bacterium]|jgi:ABC-type uncharacterized transport system auxiliary subunit
MTHARSKLMALVLAALSSLALLSANGCAGALLMPYYLIYGTDSPAIHQSEVKEIKKGSKMVVICRSNLNLYGSSNPNADLATGITYVVSQNLKDKKKKKLEWIPYSEVEDAFETDELNSLSFEKLGAKLGADYVIGVEVDSFETRHSSQFYQGSSKLHVRLVDVNNQETMFRESMPPFVYPPTPVPVSDYEETEFQKLFIVRISKDVSKLFCPYDPHDSYAQDSDFPNR